MPRIYVSDTHRVSITDVLLETPPDGCLIVFHGAERSWRSKACLIHFLTVKCLDKPFETYPEELHTGRPRFRDLYITHRGNHE